jgi:hypothetical protein
VNMPSANVATAPADVETARTDVGSGLVKIETACWNVQTGLTKPGFNSSAAQFFLAVVNLAAVTRPKNFSFPIDRQGGFCRNDRT